MSLPMNAPTLRAGPRPASNLLAPAGTDQSRQLKSLAAFEQLLLRLCLLSQAPQTDEALGRVVIELIPCLVSRELLAVQAVVALPAGDRRLALEELHANQTTHEALAAVNELVEVLVKGAEPQSIIHKVPVFLCHQRLEALRL